MPAPVVEPIPPSREVRLLVPLLAQDASYFAASARMESFVETSMLGVSLSSRMAFCATRAPLWEDFEKPLLAKRKNLHDIPFDKKPIGQRAAGRPIEHMIPASCATLMVGK